MSEWKSKADWKDREWKYVNASKTNIARTIARVKKEMKEAAEQERIEKVRPLKVANKK